MALDLLNNYSWINRKKIVMHSMGMSLIWQERVDAVQWNMHAICQRKRNEKCGKEESGVEKSIRQLSKKSALRDVKPYH